MSDLLEECLTNLQKKLTRSPIIHTESNPPSYFNLGKEARDLFSCGYHFGLLSLNIVTKSANNVKFTTTCIERLNQRNLFGSVEAQYEIFNSVFLTEKWNTDCMVAIELSSKHRPLKEVKLNLTGSVSIGNGDKVGTLDAEVSNRFCALNSRLEVGKKFSLLTSSAVFRHGGLLGGVLAKFDAMTVKVTDVNLAAGFATDDLTLHANFNNGSECGGSIFQKVTPRVDAGIQFAYSANKKSDIIFGIAGRYQAEENVSFRAKINNLSQMGLGCEQRFGDCMILSFSVLFDVRYFAEAKYKLGFSIQFES